jgi:hypothetical protein
MTSQIQTNVFLWQPYIKEIVLLHSGPRNVLSFNVCLGWLWWKNPCIAGACVPPSHSVCIWALRLLLAPERTKSSGYWALAWFSPGREQPQCCLAPIGFQLNGWTGFSVTMATLFWSLIGGVGRPWPLRLREGDDEGKKNGGDRKFGLN